MDGEQSRREKIRLGLWKKKECDAKALAVVERLLDPTAREWFRDAASFLNTAYYDDVVEERSCIRVCGYPLCHNPVAPATSKKYKISLRQNKVFDITERKKFCSSVCFKSSQHYKNQLTSGPLWLRDDNNQSADSWKTTITFYDEIDSEKGKTPAAGDGAEVLFFATQAVPSPPADDLLSSKVSSMKLSDHDHRHDDNHAPIPAEKSVATSRPLKNVGKTAVENVEASISRWFTMHTFRLMRGDRFVRRVLKENKCNFAFGNLSDDDVDGCSVSSPNRDPLFERLKQESPVHQSFLQRKSEWQQELATKSTTKTVLEPIIPLVDDENWQEPKGEDANSLEGCSMPSRGTLTNKNNNADRMYECLKEESLRHQRKVDSFLKGTTVCQQEPATSTKSTTTAIGAEPRIPLVGKCSQAVLRRRIVHEQLDRVMPDVLQLLGIQQLDAMRIVGRIVDSFSLDAESIVLKPIEWTLMAIFIIKIVSFQDAVCKNRLQNPEANKNLNLILLGYGMDEKQLDVRIETLHSDVHHLVRKANE